MIKFSRQLFLAYFNTACRKSIALLNPRRRLFSWTRSTAPTLICHTNHSFLDLFGYVAAFWLIYDRRIKHKKKKWKRRWNENDDDGIAIRCRRRRLLPPSFTWSPSSCWFLMVSTHSFEKVSRGHFDLSLTFTCNFFFRIISLS